MPSAIMTSKGQVTIPKSIRQALKVEAGDRLDFILQGERRVIVSAGVTDVAEIKGLLHRPGRRPVSIEEMNAAVARHGRHRP